jgi:hypothetical protein
MKEAMARLVIFGRFHSGWTSVHHGASRVRRFTLLSRGTFRRAHDVRRYVYCDR